MLRSILVSLRVAGSAALVSAPFMVIERWAGFAVLAVLALAFFMLRKRHLPERVQAYRAGFVIAALLLVPARFLAELMERGFDDGPFVGRPFAGDLSSLAPSERVVFRSGELVVYNRANGAAPVLVYRIADHTEWAQEMFVSMGERGEAVTHKSARNELASITGLSVSYGVVRDRLDFIGKWTYGAEHGYAFVWKWGGVQRFYLSW